MKARKNTVLLEAEDFGGRKQRLEWIDAVSKVLRDGAPLDYEEASKTFSTMSNDEILDFMMNDPRFLNTMLKASLHYLNRSIDHAYAPGNETSPGRLNQVISQNPQAITSVMALKNQQDVFSMWQERQPIYLSIPDGFDRAKLQSIETRFDEIFNLYLETRNAEVAKIQVMSLWSTLLPEKAYQALKDVWILNLDSLPASIQLQLLVATLRETIKLYKQRLDSTSNSVIDQMFELPTAKLLPALTEPTLNREGFWRHFTNTETNLNRKRAAYVLKTYFCDDLKPIEIESGGLSKEGKHASHPQCQACHYKLDPIAGLFRDYGKEGVFDLNETTFDGSEKVFRLEQRLAFQNNWRASTGDWLVGFYTGPGERHGQWSGETLADLWPFLRRSEEARMCYVKKIAEYFLKNQIVDIQWIRSISSQVKPGVQSANGLKSFIKQLMLSDTMWQRNPDPNRCYDRLPIKSGEKSIPCEVADIIEKTCASCHSNDEYSLNVRQWAWNGGGYSFRHVGSAGNLSAKESFQLIRERLLEKDVDLRMPLNRPISDYDRKVLIDWVERSILDLNGETRNAE